MAAKINGNKEVVELLTKAGAEDKPKTEVSDAQERDTRCCCNII
jgi:hypothetical protein